ncbi:MAG: M20/M25/M40 family metallo-hydrolase [Gemmataceae bacterium]
MLRLACLPLLLLIGVIFAAAPATPSDPTRGPALGPDDALIAAAQKDSSLIPNLHYLSDVIGPRLTGSANLNKACAWAADRMRDYGLENVTLEPWTIPEGWERGDCRARLVEPDNGVRINLASYGWRPGTDGKVTGDVVAITARTMTELNKYKGKMKGAIVLSGPPTKMRPFEDINKGGFAAMYGAGAAGKKGAPPERPNYAEMMAFQKERDSFLKREGAVAIFLDSGKPFGLMNTTGGWGKERSSVAEKLPTLSLAHDSYAMLYRLATRGGSAKTRLELEVSNKFIPGPIKVYNVVGELRGSEKPDEVVVVGAHIDSWDLGQGTTDNGTGTCVTLEVARMLSRTGVKPKRTVRFCLFSGEEQGLYGSRYHVEKHADGMDKVSAALLHDVGTGKINGLGVGNRPAIAALLEKELGSLKAVGLVDFKARSGGGSDHQSFEGKGVPGFLMSQDMAYYTVSHHTAADTPERILEADLVQGATVMAVTAVRIANLDKLLPREKQAGGKGRRAGE